MPKHTVTDRRLYLDETKTKLVTEGGAFLVAVAGGRVPDEFADQYQKMVSKPANKQAKTPENKADTATDVEK